MLPNKMAGRIILLTVVLQLLVLQPSHANHLEPVRQEANPVTIHSDWDIEWLPDSTTLVTIGAWGIQAYRLTDKSVIPDSRIYLTGIISDLQIIDKDVLAISDWSGEVCLVGVPDWGGLRCQKLSDKAIKRMSLSENGKYLGISSEDEIYLAEVNTRARHVQIISRMESGETGDIAVMNAGVGFTGGGLLEPLRVWDMIRAEEYRGLRFNLDGGVQDIDIRPNQEMFATGRGAFSAILWDIHSLIPHEQLYSSDSSPRWAVRFSPDGNQLAVGTAYGTVETWDISTLKLLSSTDLGEAGVTHLAYSPDGQYLAARTEDSSVYILPIRE